jgi:hypothetical protein
LINFLPQRSQRSQSPFCRSGILGRARVARAGDGVLAIASFSSTKGEGGPRYPNALALTYATLPPIYLRLRRFRKPSSSEKPIHLWHRDQRSWSSFCCSVRCPSGNSGEHTPLACWFRLLAETNFPLYLQSSRTSLCGQVPSYCRSCYPRSPRQPGDGVLAIGAA